MLTMDDKIHENTYITKNDYDVALRWYVFVVPGMHFSISMAEISVIHRLFGLNEVYLETIHLY